MTEFVKPTIDTLADIGAIDADHSQAIARAKFGLSTVEFSWPYKYDVFKSTTAIAPNWSHSKLRDRGIVKLVQATRSLVIGRGVSVVYDNTYSPSISVETEQGIVFNEKTIRRGFFADRRRARDQMRVEAH